MLNRPIRRKRKSGRFPITAALVLLFCSGPVSAAGPVNGLVLAEGSTQARLLSSRFAENIDVRDFGALLNGVNDDGPAFALAQQAAQKLGGAMIVVPSGTPYLGSSIYTIRQNGWMIYPGVTFKGPGQIVGLTDSVSSNNALTLAKFSDAGGQNALFISHYVGASQQAQSYENNALYSRIISSDPSSSTALKDAVAGEFQAIMSNNRAGRIWGINPMAIIDPDSDGYAVGGEIAVQNDGLAQPFIDQPNSKIGLDIIAAGSSNSTIGLLIQGVNAKWQDGIMIKSPGLAGEAFRLVAPANSGWKDVASIDRAGNAMFQQLGANGAMPVGKQVVTGSRSGCPALGSLITSMAAYGLVTDMTTP